ncbi:hypothetical protein MRB53_036943 [Persea americana]|nr:hypothetical protein MRB53_036943 [Persea americana]
MNVSTRALWPTQPELCAQASTVMPQHAKLTNAAARRARCIKANHCKIRQMVPFPTLPEPASSIKPLIQATGSRPGVLTAPAVSNVGKKRPVMMIFG